jgi:predicted nucleic acid-binding protein
MERQVICLDTNYLICGLIRGTKEAKQLMEWHRAGKVLLTATPAWYEFLCGPVAEPQVAVIRNFLSGGIPAFSETHAAEAARLFNAVGRIRSLRIDAMIAATALLANARLATSNQNDFRAFAPHGLVLLES